MYLGFFLHSPLLAQLLQFLFSSEQAFLAGFEGAGLQCPQRTGQFFFIQGPFYDFMSQNPIPFQDLQSTLGLSAHTAAES
jgi:hypothetical protein